jgi:tetratricopeptide (TPR) repeat protein
MHCTQTSSAVADKAVEVARSGGASDDVCESAEALLREADAKTTQAERNQQLLTALLDITPPRETGEYKKNKAGQMVVSALPSVDEQFAQAFRLWGLDIDHTSVEDAVVRLKEQPDPVVQELVAGLDAWTIERRRDDPSIADWRRPMELAERLDTSERRRQVRRLLADSPLRRTKATTAQWNRARGQLGKLVGDVDPATEPVLSVQALALALQYFGDNEMADTILRSALATRPDAICLLDALGRLLEQQPLRMTEAVECYRAARALRPQLGIALGAALSNVDRAHEGEAILREMVRQQPDNPQRLLYLSEALYAQEKFVEAEVTCRRAIQIMPNFPEAYCHLGLALAEQRKLEEAEVAYREAIKIKPNLDSAHHGLGAVLHVQGKLKEAVVAHRKAIDITPNFFEAYFALGAVLYALEKPDEAEVTARKAIEIEPNCAEAYHLLGLALLSQNKLVDAVTACRKEVAITPKNAEAYRLLGLVLYEQRELKEAEAAYRQALGIKPRWAEASHFLGLILYDQNKLDEAVVAYRQALAIKPKYAEASYFLGVALADQEKPGEAEVALRAAIEFKPDYIEAYMHLGLVLLSQKKLGEAVAVFRKADQLPNKHPSIQTKLRQTERWLRLEKKLPAILAEKEQPGSPKERLEFADLCFHYKRFYMAATRLYDAAFAAEPKLADDLKAADRYNAACAAALAAVGYGEDAKEISVEKLASLQQSTHDWLRADLAALAKLVEQSDKESRQFVQQRLTHWQHNANLIAVREKKWLDAMPDADRERWQKLWTDVNALLELAAEKK